MGKKKKNKKKTVGSNDFGEVQVVIGRNDTNSISETARLAGF